MALPPVGLSAVIENLDSFNKGADSIQRAYDDISAGAAGVEETTGEASSALDTMGNIASSVASGGLALLTTAIAGVAAIATGAVVGFGLMAKAALDASQDVESASNALIIGTGASGKALEEMEEIVINLSESSASVGKSYEEMGATVAEVNTRLGLTGTELEETSAQILKYSRLTGEDAVASTRLVTRVMGDWGLEADETGFILDRLFGASQAFGISTDDLSQKIVQFGAPLRQMGFSLEESIALFGKWEKEGVNAELAIGSLRIAAGKFANENIPLQEGLRDTIAAIQSASTESEGLAIAMDVFGARAGPDMAAAIREGRFELDSATVALINTTGSLEDAADRTLTFGDQMGIMWNKVRNALLPFGDEMLRAGTEIMPLVEQAINNMRPALEQLSILFGEILTGAIESLIPWIQDTLLPALTRFGFWIQDTGIPALETLVETLSTDVTPAFSDLVTALGELAAAFGSTTDEANTLEPVIKFLSGTITFITESVTSAVQEFTALVTAIRSVTDTAVPLQERILNLATALGNLAVPDIFQPGSPTPFELALSGILGVLGQVTQSLGSGFNIIIRDVASNLASLQSIMISTFTRSIAVFSKLVIPAFQLAASAVQTIHDLFIALSTDVLPKVAADISSFASDAASNLGRVSAALASMANVDFSSLQSGFDTISNKLKTVKDRADDARQELGSFADVEFGGLLSDLIQVDNVIKDIIVDLQDAIDLMGQLGTPVSPLSMSSAIVAAPASINAPVLGATGNTVINNNFSLGNNTFNTQTDPAVFEAKVLNVIRANL